MFKESFKYYKSKNAVPNFSEVLDFRGTPPKEANLIKINDNIGRLPLGMKPVKEWKCYEISSRPGLIFISNPFTASGQRYWISKCLRDYPKSPNVVNLSPKHFSQDAIEDWWSALQSSKDKNIKQKLKTSMRWTTLGYHHDWDTKVYSEEMKNTFPYDLKKLSSFFANVLNLGKYTAEAAIVNYYPIGTTLAGHTDHSELDLEAPLFSFSFGQTAIFLIGGRTKEEKPTGIFLRSGDVIVMSKESRLCYHAVPRVMQETGKKPWNELQEEDFINESIHGCGPPNSKRSRKSSDGDNNSNENVGDNDDPETGNIACSEIVDITQFRSCFDNKFWSPFEWYLEDSRININVRQVLKSGQISLQ